MNIEEKINSKYVMMCYIPRNKKSQIIILYPIVLNCHFCKSVKEYPYYVNNKKVI